MRVQVGDAVGTHLLGQGHALGHVLTRQAGQHRQDLAEGLPHRLLVQARAQAGPQALQQVGAGHPAHGGPDPGDLGVEARVGGGAQGVDAQAVSQGLTGQDLGDDEGLGEPGVDLQDVADVGCGHDVLLGLVVAGAAGRWWEGRPRAGA